MVQSTFPLEQLRTMSEVVESWRLNAHNVAVKRENQKTHNDDYLMADTQSECRVLVKRKDEDKHRRNMCTLQGIICPLKCGEKVKTFLLLLHSALKKIWA